MWTKIMQTEVPWTNVMQALLEFKWLVMVTVGVGLLVGIIGLLLSRNLRWHQKRVKVLGVFLNLSARDNLLLCIALSRCLFVVSAVAFCVGIDTTQLCLFIMLCILYNLLAFRFSVFLFDLFNSAVICAALLVGNILTGFLQEVRFDWRTITVYVLLAIFISVYSAFFFLRDVARIAQREPKRKGIKNEEEQEAT
ncbi:MAG TPA: hypothetical protein GX395_07955 [Clostridia bacterium]|jgi:hypothetical protein|nr:hypothetical protein [Clostridia bacterium]